MFKTLNMNDKWQLIVIYVSEYCCGKQAGVLCFVQKEWKYEPNVAKLSRKIWILLKCDIFQFLNVGKKFDIM